MSTDNGTPAGPGGFARLRKLLEQYEENAAAIRKVLALAGEAAADSASRRAGATLSQALKLEQHRKGVGWSTVVPPATREARLAALREILGAHPDGLSMKDLVEVVAPRIGQRLSKDRIRQILHEMPEVERTGSTFQALWRLRPARSAVAARHVPARRLPARDHVRKRHAHQQRLEVKRSAKRPATGYDGSRAEKARAIVQLVKDSEGGILDLRSLVLKARAAGIASLTGMVNYTRAGWLRRTRNRRGKTAYRFLRMPPEPPAPTTPATVETIE